MHVLRRRSVRAHEELVGGEPSRRRRGSEAERVERSLVETAARLQVRDAEVDVIEETPCVCLRHAQPNRKDAAADLAQRIAAEADLVAVLEERPLASVREFHRLLPFQLSSIRLPCCRARCRRSCPRPSGRRSDAAPSTSRARAAAASSSRGRARFLARQRSVQLDLERDVERPVALDAQVRQRLGACSGAGTRRSSRSASGVTQAETEVAKLLPRNGPSGTYSQAWMSRALQSLTSTIRRRGRGTPLPSPLSSVLGTPTTKPSSSSMSSRRDGPTTAVGSGGLDWPSAGVRACR